MSILSTQVYSIHTLYAKEGAPLYYTTILQANQNHFLQVQLKETGHSDTLSLIRTLLSLWSSTCDYVAVYKYEAY